MHSFRHLKQLPMLPFESICFFESLHCSFDCQNKIIMIQNAKTDSSSIPHLFAGRFSKSSYQIQQRQVPNQGLHQLKSQLFKLRFKNNQQSLKSKFKSYIREQQILFPRTYHKLSRTFLTEGPEQIKNVRKIRDQKKKLIQELSHSMNESQYFLHKSQQYEKTCHLLSKRMRKIEGLRKERKSEVIRMEQTLRDMSSEIKKEKLRSKKKVDDLKVNITRSRIETEKRKLSQAQSVRVQREIHEQSIFEQKYQSYKEKQRKYLSVREDERKIELTVSRSIQQKKFKVQELKLQKIFHELAQKQEIKIISTRIQKEAKKKIEKCKNKAVVYENKIREFRKSLGERRLEPPPMITLNKFRKERSFTESRDFSTNCGVHSRVKEVNSSEEPFADQ